MATDPYHTFAADLRSSLESARQLSHRYTTLQQQKKEQRISSSSSTSSSSLASPLGIDNEIREVYTNLQDQLENLENDINDVQESVEMLERRGPELFGVDSAELGRRKRFVQNCTDEVRVSPHHRYRVKRAASLRACHRNNERVLLDRYMKVRGVIEQGIKR